MDIQNVRDTDAQTVYVEVGEEKVEVVEEVVEGEVEAEVEFHQAREEEEEETFCNS